MNVKKQHHISKRVTGVAYNSAIILMLSIANQLKYVQEMRERERDVRSTKAFHMKQTSQYIYRYILQLILSFTNTDT